MLARRGADLVHRARAADEQRDATRSEARDRAGDEVVVEPQAEREGGGIGTDDAVRERRIADHQVEAAGKIAAGVVLAADAGFRVDEVGNPRRHGIVFDASELHCATQGVRQQGEEQAGAHARLEYTAAGEGETQRGVPQSADNALGRVVGVLRRALQGRIFGRRHRVGEGTTDRFPSVAVSRRSGLRKAVLGEFGGTEADEAQQPCLLFRRRRTTRRFDLLRQADRRDIVTGAGDPSARERALAVEDIVAAVRGRSGFARWCLGVSLMHVRCVISGNRRGSLHARSETGASNRARVNCAASGTSLSDGERLRAPSFARCVVAVAMDGSLTGLTVQAGTGGRLPGAVHDLNDGALDRVDVRRCVTMWTRTLVSVGSEPRHVDLHFLPEDPSRAPPGAAGARAKPA